MKKKFISILILLISLMFLVSPVMAKGQTSSVYGDWFNRVFDIDLTDGASFFEFNKSKRIDYNDKILQNKTIPNISLYDRFGGDIKFIPYFGEKRFSFSTVDVFYSNMKENNEDFKFKVTDIFKSEDGEMNTVVYEGRPEILSDIEISADKKDPRVDAYDMVSITGGDATVGNFYMELSKTITSFVGFLSGTNLYEIVSDLWTMVIESDFYEAFTGMVKLLIPILIALFVIGLIGTTKRYLGGEISFGFMLTSGLNFILALGIMYSLFSNMNVLKPIADFVVNTSDSLFSTALNQTVSEVIKSEDDTYIVEAALWEKTVFEPWTISMFGDTYENLYTNYEKDSSKTKMKQSNSNIEGVWDGSLRYNSSKHTGDITVPLGNSKEIRNWAALAWSTQSLYHIDAVEETEYIENRSWPRAETAPKNNQIYVDNFRWLDAKLNISPGYEEEGEEIANYQDSKGYEHNFAFYGFLSLYRSLLLAPLLIPIFKRFEDLMKIVSIGLRWMIMSITTVIRPSAYDHKIGKTLTKLLLPLYHYFWWSMILYLMLTIYLAIAGNFFGDILWIVFSIFLIKTQPVQNKSDFHKAKVKITRNFNNAKRKIKDTFQN